MTRVIIHAGYHKSGTTCLQNFMRNNKALLKQHLHYVGKKELGAAGTNARIYAQRPFPWRLNRFRRAFRAFLHDVPACDTLVISRETLSGGMPGHRRMGGGLMTSYFGPALKLARVIIDETRRRFGASTDIVFFYTIREREAWIRSVHGHLLRSIRLTDDFDTFRARFPTLSSPAEEAARMREALAPVPVVTANLEDYQEHREGPAAALLDLAAIPPETRAQLSRAMRANAGESDDMRKAFLDLNRKIRNRSALKNAKEHLLAERRANA